MNFESSEWIIPVIALTTLVIKLLGKFLQPCNGKKKSGKKKGKKKHGKK